jgi:hypothetical protein
MQIDMGHRAGPLGVAHLYRRSLSLRMNQRFCHFFPSMPSDCLLSHPSLPTGQVGGPCVSLRVDSMHVRFRATPLRLNQKLKTRDAIIRAASQTARDAGQIGCSGQQTAACPEPATAAPPLATPLSHTPQDASAQTERCARRELQRGREKPSRAWRAREPAGITMCASHQAHLPGSGGRPWTASSKAFNVDVFVGT